MKNIEDYDHRFWGLLLEFVFSDEARLPRNEVQAELQKLGIDVRGGWQKIRMALEYSRQSENAKANLESAKKKRPLLLAKLRTIQVPYLSLADIRGKIQEIAERLGTPQPGVYYRKLENAPSDKDLKTLLEDLLRMEEFSKDSNDAES